MLNKRFCFALVTMCLLLVIFHTVIAEDMEKNTPAKELTNACVYDMPSRNRTKLTDKNDFSRLFLSPGEEIRIHWKNYVPVHSILVKFAEKPEPYMVSEIDANGDILSTVPGKMLLNSATVISADARGVIIKAGDAGIFISSLFTFGEGDVPNTHDWAERPEKADYMLIATHPDDDVLFLGGIIPLFEGKDGKKGIDVIACSVDRLRYDEAMNAAYTMGLGCEPLFLGFIDSGSKRDRPLYDVDDITLRLVRLIRQYRPDVIVTQDENGEYGHWQHRNTVEAVKQAVLSASSQEYDPDSVSEYGCWNVSKLYLHLCKKEPIYLNVEAPLPERGGKTALEIVQEAYSCHRSQIKKTKHRVRNKGVYDLTAFGLYYSSVGKDPDNCTDIFANISATR